MRRLWTGLVSALGLMLLILDAKTALNGAADGIELCLMTVIPSLLPFFILSILLTSSLMGQRIRLLEPLGRLCGMPKGSESLLVIGLLGGYPVGAQSVAQAYRSGQLSRRDAQRLLGFCSNAGPAFLFGMVAMKFSSAWIAWVLWGIHILSALIVGILLPGKSDGSAEIRAGIPMTVPEALERSVKIMVSVCAWVTVFRVIIAFFDRWFLWLLPTDGQVAVIGILELANGCCELELIQSEGLRFILCAGILALGGLCVAMQTVSVTAQLGTGWYFPGKLLQCAVSVFLAASVQFFLFPATHRSSAAIYILLISGSVLALSVFLMRKKQKNSSIPALVGV